MSKKFAALVAIALLAFIPRLAAAQLAVRGGPEETHSVNSEPVEENSISNAQLTDILNIEATATNQIANLTSQTQVLDQANLTLAEKIQLQEKALASVEGLEQIELTELTAFEQSRSNSLLTVQNQLAQGIETLLSQDRVLLSLTSENASKQMIAQQLIAILATEHSIAALMLQKQSLLMGTFPSEIASQTELQYNDWNLLINYTRVWEQITLL